MRIRGLSIALLAAVAAMVVWSQVAVALETHFYTGNSFGPDGTSGSAFNEPGPLAADSAGNVYVADLAAGSIDKFSPDGLQVDFSATPGSNSISGIDFRGAAESQIAVAPAGAIYATATNGHSISAFAASGAPLNFTVGPGAGTNELPGFGEALGVAVDANGAIYVADYTDGTGVSVYSPAGELLTTFASFQSANIAVDSTGGVYVASYLSSVTRYDPSSFPVTASTTYSSAGVVDPDRSYSVFVNQATDDLYVAHPDYVTEYNSTGTQISTFPSPSSGLLTESLGIAAFGSGVDEAVYASDSAGTKKIRIFGPQVTVPTVTTSAASNLTNTTATISGIINPSGTESFYQFEYGLTTNYDQTSPAAPAPAGADTTDHEVTADLVDLLPNTLYHYRLVGQNSAGQNPGEDLTFLTPGPAGVETTGTLLRTATTALLEGRLNPQDKPTSYFFEYGLVGACPGAGCTQTPTAILDEGDELILVAQRIAGLQPGSTYNYRLIADNGNVTGPVAGVTMSVTTRGGDQSLTHGPFNGPPDSDRAWEQVNIPDTGGRAVNELRAVSANGERVIYNVKGGVPSGTVGSLYTPVFAERTETGWTSQIPTPPQPDEPNLGVTWEKLTASDDLSASVGKRSRNDSSLWLMAPAKPASLLFSGTFDEGGTESHQVGFFAMSRSGNRVVATRSDVPNPQLYDVTSGSPTPISFLPSGDAPLCGVALTGGPSATLMPAGESTSLTASGWVSPNGRYVYFSSAGDICDPALSPVQLYARDLNENLTKRLSPPALSGPTCSVALVRSEGDIAYFWTGSRLTADDNAPAACPGGPGNEAQLVDDGDVYRAEFQTGSVVCVTCVNPDKPTDVALSVGFRNGGLASIAIADDGSRIYFSSKASLTPGAPAPAVYRLNTSTNEIHYVAPANVDPSRTAQTVGQLPNADSAMSTDGSSIVFVSDDQRLNPVGGLSNGGTQQYYLYNDLNQSLSCVSCPQDGSAPTAGVDTTRAEGGLVSAFGTNAGGPNLTPISSNGSIFAFTSPTPLVRADENTASSTQLPPGGSDAYEWRDGRLLLVSDGVTNWSEEFGAKIAQPAIAGVSQSGRDIYVTLATQLTPDALDSAPRLYDARIGGGFRFPVSTPPCPLEVCQGTPTAPPSQPTPGSSAFQGPANPKPGKGKQCPKGKHKKKSGGKVRCVKNKPKRAKGNKSHRTSVSTGQTGGSK